MAGFRDDDAEKDVKVVYGEIKIIINHQLIYTEIFDAAVPPVQPPLGAISGRISNISGGISDIIGEISDTSR